MTDRYFIHWIGLPTWDSMHQMDMMRFYQFVKALRTYSRKSWQNMLYKNIILAARDYHSNVNENHLIDMAEFFTGQANIVLDFDSTTFPDPLVEMKNPRLVLAYLRQFHQAADLNGNTRPLYTPEQLENIMIENFGANWRNKRTTSRNKKS